MEPAIESTATKKFLYVLAGLGGISLVILIHEIGHFLFAQIFNVPTPVFSLGFGPTLFACALGKTVFKIALLPFGGYVQMDEQILAQQDYIPKMLIIFGGILFNLIFAYCVLIYYAFFRDKNMQHLSLLTSIKESHMKCGQVTRDMGKSIANIMTEKDHHNLIMGPIGIVSLIGKSLEINPQLYWFILAILSLNMAFFNVLPLPFFDGGQAMRFTIEALIGKAISPHIMWIISVVFLALFIAFIMQVTMNDIRRLMRR